MQSADGQVQYCNSVAWTIVKSICNLFCACENKYLILSPSCFELHCFECVQTHLEMFLLKYVHSQKDTADNHS